MTGGPTAGSVAAAGLAGLPSMTPVRLAAILADRDPVAAWHAVCSGSHPADERRFFAASARCVDLCSVGERYRHAGVRILLRHDRDYPSVLRNDPGAPAVLFARGSITALEGRRRVAIVGTRSATPYGRQVASELGRDLAAAGVVVVSGLARGIDGAAHSGALGTVADDAGPPVAVVGTGVDVVYPSSHARLWEDVVTRGAVLSEAPLGAEPRRGSFPARNRIIAALSDVVVVVESHVRGGSMYTAEAAARRSIPVCAVPGSVRSRASEGTNGLLVDGCTPVRDADDVLVAVSLARAGRERPSPVPDTATLVSAKGRSRHRREQAAGRSDERPGRSPADTSRVPAPEEAVLAAVDDTPTTFETILVRTGLGIAEAAGACDRLEGSGRIRSGAGWWSRR